MSSQHRGMGIGAYPRNRHLHLHRGDGHCSNPPWRPIPLCTVAPANPCHEHLRCLEVCEKNAMLLTLPATCCVLLLFAHSLYLRPLRATLLIFAFIIPASMLYGGPNFYIFNIPSATVPFMFVMKSYPVPLINLVGFIFTFYCGLSLALHIFEDKEGRRTAPFFSVLAGIVYINAMIGIAIEHINFAAKWWQWTPGQAEQLFSNSPTVVPVVLFFFGVWGWRSLLIFPVLLNFFVVRKEHKWRSWLYPVLWFAFFMTWMRYVDTFSILQEFFTLLWIILPLLARIFKKPEISLDLLQYNRPKPRPRT